MVEVAFIEQFSRRKADHKYKKQLYAAYPRNFRWGVFTEKDSLANNHR